MVIFCYITEPVSDLTVPDVIDSQMRFSKWLINSPEIRLTDKYDPSALKKEGLAHSLMFAVNSELCTDVLCSVYTE